MPTSMLPCESCDGRRMRYRYAERCKSCYEGTRSNPIKQSCPECNGENMRDRRAKMCKPCYLKSHRRPSNYICPSCGEPKSDGASYCIECLPNRSPRQPRFNHLALRRLFESSELELTPQQAAHLSGISISTIRRWLSGRFYPNAYELQKLVRALSLRRCETCDGLGYVDPAAAVVSRKTQIIRKEPVFNIISSKISVVGVVLDTIDSSVSYNEKKHHLSPSQLRILAFVMSEPNRYCPTADVVVSCGISSRNILASHLVKIRRILRKIGAPILLENRQDLGYTVIPLKTEEAAS